MKVTKTNHTGSSVKRMTISREEMNLDDSLYSFSNNSINKNFIYQLILNNMYTIVIKKTPTTRLFDRMPMPKARVRHIDLARKALTSRIVSIPFERKVSRIQ